MPETNGKKHSSEPVEFDRASVASEKIGWYENWKDFPKTVFAIFGNEFCERFSYYGMRTVLTLYVVNVMGIQPKYAVALFHSFIVVCYTSPIAGSILADGYIGKFHTILWVSLFYASGNVVLAIAATFPVGNAVHPYLDFLGLLIIGLGTGGIKPCVSAFGGDQFKKGQERMLEAFFSVFYFSINAGALVSTFITPLMRASSCLGQGTCYPAAFGMPAVLMLISVVMFVAGSPWYTKRPPKENIIALTVKAIAKAVKNKRASKEKKEHFMDHLTDDHDCGESPRCTKTECHQAQFAKDVTALLRVCMMYLPVPVFWALYDMQGSRWVLQAVLMDGHIGSITLLPDQMGTLNSFLILFFIPIFQGIVYPLVRKCGIDPTPLRRMVAGGLLASVSFVIAAIVQMSVAGTQTTNPPAGSFGLTFANLYSCPVNVTVGTGNTLTHTNFTNIPPMGSMSTRPFPSAVSGKAVQVLNWNVAGQCVNNGAGTTVTTNTTDASLYLSVVAPNQYLTNTSKATVLKAETGEGQFKMAVTNMMTNFNDQRFMFWCLCSTNDDCSKQTTCDPSTIDNFQPLYMKIQNTTAFYELKPGAWRLFDSAQAGYNDISWKNNKTYPFVPTNINFTIFDQGGIYDMIVFGKYSSNNTILQQMTWQVAPANTVSIAMQVPQYIVITAGEILFSITGLEFSYSQAPVSMKSCVQAAWLLTVAGGDLIDVIIAVAPLGVSVAWELLIFAILMAVVIVIFMFMSIYMYEYTFYENDDGDDGHEMDHMILAEKNDPIETDPH